MRMKDYKLIEEIAKILITEECKNWVWEVINQTLRNKYLKQAEKIYDKLIDLGYKKEIL